MQHLRRYHALLAVLVLLAHVSGDDSLLHAWLGYGIAALIVLRLLVVPLAAGPQLGLMRFYPHFEGLRLGHFLTHPAISRTLMLGIAVCLISVTLTGIAMDRGHAVGLGGPAIDATRSHGAHDTDDDDDSFIGEGHETFADLLLLLISAHVFYLLIFKRPLARYMLFLQTRKRETPP